MIKYLGVRIPMDLYKKLEKKAKSMNISISSLVRIILTEYLYEEE